MGDSSVRPFLVTLALRLVLSVRPDLGAGSRGGWVCLFFGVVVMGPTVKNKEAVRRARARAMKRLGVFHMTKYSYYVLVYSKIRECTKQLDPWVAGRSYCCVRGSVPLRRHRIGQSNDPSRGRH